MRDTTTTSTTWITRQLSRAWAGAAAGLLTAAAQPCLAEPPPGQPVPIEQWYGLRRIDPGANPPPPQAAEPETTSPAALPALPPAAVELPPPVATTEIVPAQAATAGQSVKRADVPARTEAPEPRPLPPLGPVGALETTTPSRTSDSPVNPATAPVGGQRGSATIEAPTPARPVEGRQTESAEPRLLTQVVSLFGAAFLGPLAAAGVLLLLLRRRVARAGPLFRIEYAGSVAVPPSPPVWGRRLNSAADPSGAAATGQDGNGGPGSAASATSPQEEAVLQALLAENLRMMEQLNERRTTDE